MECEVFAGTTARGRLVGGLGRVARACCGGAGAGGRAGGLAEAGRGRGTGGGREAGREAGRGGGERGRFGSLARASCCLRKVG